jgi:maltooligosyltrehalose trehalohydrolase
MTALSDGWHELATKEAIAGTQYSFELTNSMRVPDPASRYQPRDVHGPSEVVDPGAYQWRDGSWQGRPWHEAVLYEMHIGAFTPEGTFQAAIERLDHLVELGITALELMPLADFPGARNWGYDGVLLFAPDASYGRPEDLKAFVDAAHDKGLMVFLDVVYNHFGPDGNYLPVYAPQILTDRHKTPWGSAINYDGTDATPMREFVIHNALYWLEEFRLDGLRLDAVHAIYDDSPVHVLKELRERVAGLVTSEMGPDDLRPIEEWGHDAMWLDSLHHELHVLLTGEHEGYYEPFGSLDGLVRELTRPEAERLIVCAQNHDQVGNRAVGDRLPADAHRVALAVVLFSLNTPLLFVGEEHDETAPFQFFTDHIDPFIADATREGRKREFASFASFSGEEVPDPQAEATFERSRISQPAPDPFYAELIRLRRELPRTLEVSAEGHVLTMRRGAATLVADFDARTVELER